MKTIKIVLLLILAVTSYCYAQTEEIRALKIGDTVPDLTITKLLRSTKSNIKLSDYRGKLIIIDFWATYCIPCIREFPRLEKLQKDYENDIKIIPVTKQKKEVVEKAFRTIPSIKKIKLITAYEDELLYRLFPHTTVPHDIVIDKNGIVIAITSSENINEDHLKKWLSGQKIDTYQKFSDVKVDIKRLDNINAPRFIDTAYSKILLTYGILTKSINGFGGGMSQNGINGRKATKLAGFNATIVNLYRVAFKNAVTKMPLNRVKKNVRDTTLLEEHPSLEFPEKRRIFLENKTFNYDFSVPEGSGIDVGQFLKSYLDMYFKLKSRLDSQVVDCYVIKSLDPSKYSPKGKERILDMGKELWSFHNFEIGELRFRLDERSSTPILLDLPIRTLADISIKPEINNFEKFKAEFNKNGLDLVKEKRKLEVLVIEDQN